jgi:hypothetical protein
VTRALLIACVLFVGCDRADELFAAGIQAVLEDPPRKTTIVCKPGEPARAIDGGKVLLTVHCEPVGGAR